MERGVVQADSKALSVELKSGGVIVAKSNDTDNLNDVTEREAQAWDII